MATGPEVTRAAGAAKEQAREAWNDAKEMARSRVGEKQNVAAKGIGDFAGALRQAARSVDDEGPVPVSRLAENVADRLERFSGTLRTKDLNSMLRDVESFARSQPVVFFGAAMAVGFFAMRFLRSSATQSETAFAGDREGQGWDWPRGADYDAGNAGEATRSSFQTGADREAGLANEATGRFPQTGADRDAGIAAEAMRRSPQADELATDPSTGTGDLAGSTTRSSRDPQR